MQIEINDEIANQILLTELSSAIQYTKEDINKLKKIKARERYQKADLKHNEGMLPHLEAVYDYFGGNLK